MKNIIDFKDYLIEKEKSSKTIEAYLRDIRQFEKYLKENKINEIHNSTLKKYRDFLLHSKFLAPTSVNRKLVAINQFCSFNEINVLNVRAKFQLQNFLENVITKEETERMINAAKKKKDYRAIALIKTLELTGMRISEVLNITIHDINHSAIQTIGKGNKIRTVFIPDALNKSWIDYCKYQRNYVYSDILFVGQRGRMTDKGTNLIVKKYAELANVPIKKAHHHSWRHAYVLRLLDKGVSLEEVCDLVGHSNINITKGYARKTKEQLINIINNLD